jgi:hypothetical protein
MDQAQGENPSDSGFLIPDSGFLKPHACGSEGSPVADQGGSSVFARIREVYPKRSGSHRWQDAEKHFRARLREGHTAEEILAGVERYAAFVRADGTEGSSYVQQAATFLGTNKGFLEPWTHTAAPQKKQVYEPRRAREFPS